MSCVCDVCVRCWPLALGPWPLALVSYVCVCVSCVCCVRALGVYVLCVCVSGKVVNCVSGKVLSCVCIVCVRCWPFALGPLALGP